MRHLIRFLALLLVATSMATIPGAAVDAEEIVPVAVDFELGTVRGFVFVEASERVVVVGDDEVLMFGLDGSLLHRVTGIGNATGAEEWGSHVVVIAAATHELVVIDTVSGAVVRRIQSGAEDLSSVAVAGHTVWFSSGSGPTNGTGIGRADLATGELHSAHLSPNNLFSGSIIDVSAGLPGPVFFVNSFSTTGYLRVDEDGTSLAAPGLSDGRSLIVSEAGDRLWTVNRGQLVELSTSTLTLTGTAYSYAEYNYGGEQLQLAGHGDRWLASGYRKDLYLFEVGRSEPLNRIRFHDEVSAVDVSADRLFAIEAFFPRHGQASTRSKTLWIAPHDFERRQAISIGVDAHGMPSGARPNLSYTCSDGTAGQIDRLPYGWWTTLDVSADATWCNLWLSHVDEPHRTYLFSADGSLVENTWTTLQLTGDLNRDVVVYLQVLRSPLNDATRFVEQQYHDILQRSPDSAGVQYWANLLQTGAIADFQMVQKFVESPEFLGSMAPAMRLYLAYFGRWPDDPGLDHWANAIRSGTRVSQISDFFATSPEFIARYGSLSDRDFVTLVYANVLGRAPDATGYNFWLGRMATGMSRGQVMTNFSESPEYIAQTRAPITVRSLYLGLLQREPDAAGFAFWTERNRTEPSLAPLIIGFLDSEEYADRFWFWDEGPLPATRAGGLRRAGADSVEMSRCGARCYDGPTVWSDLVRNLAE